MAVSQAQKIAKAKYQQTKRTLIAAEVSKDKGEFYRVSAVGLGISLSKLVQYGVDEYIKNHGGAVVAVDKQQDDKKLPSPADEKLLAEFSKLPVDAQKYFLLAFKAINNQKGGGQND